MYVRGIRGANTVKENDADEILQATGDLLRQIVTSNHIDPRDICSVYITVTNDLDAVFPAKAIRQMPGWELVPLMCSLEIPVPNSLSKCIRLMLLLNTNKGQHELVHVYLNETKSLRPDLGS